MRDNELRQARARLQQIEAKATRIDEMEKQIFDLKSLHAQEINGLIT